MIVKTLFLFILISFCLLASCQQPASQQSSAVKKIADEIVEPVGGPFQNGEFMYIGMPDEMNAVDTSAAWNQGGQKIKLHGKILEQDGITPAPNVVLYYYHTDTKGLYSANKNLDKKARRHGDLRGWVKSDAGGNYSIFTIRPAPYPNFKEPAHIHFSVKELQINEYYIDNIVFDDDPFLTQKERATLQNRGGSGILKGQVENGIWVAERDIILGLNIPDYPDNEH